MGNYWEYLKSHLFGAEGQYEGQNNSYADEVIDYWKEEITTLPKDIGIGSSEPFNKWLYEAEKWDQDDYIKFYTLYSLPVVSSYIDYLYDKRSTEEYFARHGLSYKDVHDPRKLLHTSSARSTVSGVTNFVSHNLDKLYR